MVSTYIEHSAFSQDLQLAQAAAAGDEQAWRRIYDQTHARLYNFLCYQTGNCEVASDLLQETYVIVYTRLSMYSGRGSLLGWLRRVALRKCLDWRRRVAARMRSLAALARESVADLSRHNHQQFAGLGQGLEEALDRLTPRQRAVLLLRELEDQSFAEISECLGCSEATSRVHHHRACQKMRQWLTKGERLTIDNRAGGIS